ncbi:FMN-dependent NADH-azoreductase [Metamycoplasma hyosynoviae]|uniref:FMN-dependent NADH-azoreductase n=1 Tax=Metamycoplasma hyosynoviae TaxID=29559 RepID=UPI00235F6511|nr:FMN-dependent NADH-azoreductase [Metamycoplasma hyosynoviae]MDD1378145.1 FMN-dependent NADH-azoreductase [Metamycoplasma hyosynoviae]
MAKLLCLISSPIREELSISTYATNQFLDIYKKNHPQDEVILLDLNKEKELQNPMQASNMATYLQEEKNDEYINLLKSVDKLVIAAPMINFNVPVILKNFLDRICIANKTFSYKYSKKGDAIGLLDNLKVQIIATQGAPIDWYQWSSHFKYLEGLWNFLGAKVLPSIVIAGVKIAENIKKTKEEIYTMYEKEITKKAIEF